MEFEVLGRLAARRDGVDLALGSFKQRSLLALLLIHANEVVATDRIIDELWGDQPVGDRQNALWVHVSNLRSALEPTREKRSEGTLLLTRSPGYLLQVDPDELDEWRFERSVHEGRALLDTDPAAASIVLGEGLALWRGRPYEDVAYEPFAQPEIGRLEELRLEAVGLRIDADLRRGLSAELVGELESLVRQHPVREGFTAQLMLALYRSGRRAEALRAFTRLRARLGEELGVEPTAALQRLESQVIVGDPSLGHDGAGPVPQTRLAVRGYEIREQIGEGAFGLAYRAYQPAVGREVAITVIPPERADDPAFIRRFEAEAELVARLEHPHIVPLYDYWREPGAAYLVTRLLRGGSLADTLRAGPLAPDQAAQLVHEVGSALSLAHRLGAVHRDIKPAKILIDDDHRAYLTDFGIAVDDEAGPGSGRATLGSPYASPEQLAGAPVTPASDIYSLAVVLAQALTGRSPDDVQGVIGELREPIADVILKATSADPQDRYSDVGAFVLAVRAAVGATAAPIEAAPAEVVNPYKGLRSFEEPDAADFFGRERVVERLIARLGASGTTGRFVALVGPSGSGKSSVVKAGLLPALRLGALSGSGDWFVVEISPGRHPYEELEAGLLRVAVNPPTSLLEQLTDGDSGIRRAVRRVLPERSQLLLVIDQFEELFTQVPDATTHAFLDAVAAAVHDPRLGLRVAITLRADFYDRPLDHRAIGELLRRGTEVITPMSAEEFERAINGPAERLGVRFEPGLVAEIVADVSDRPGALPLLQYALTELFDHRRERVIQLATYRETGGVSGALIRRAEALYGGFDVPAQQAARQVLLRLITLGEETDDVRRRVLRQELTALGDPAVEVVLDAFGRHRLLSFDRDPVTRGPTVEIAHEALLTEWDRLRAWIDDSREDLRQQRRLAIAAAEWQGADRDPGYLLRGPRLEQAAAWAADTDLSLHPGERAFLGSSVAQHNAEAAAEQARRHREERLRRKTRQRTRQLVGGAVVLALVAAVAAFAVTQRNEANRLAQEQADSAEPRRLAAASILARDDPELAMLLALQSLDASADADIRAVIEAEEALHWAIQGARIPYPATDAPAEVRTGPDGPTGIFTLPVAQLVDLARSHLDRSFTAEEWRSFTADACTRYSIEPCAARTGGLGWPAIPEDPVRPELPSGDRPLAGTSITLFGCCDPITGFGDELARFKERTGIDVAYTANPSALEAQVAAAVARGDPPDLAIFPQPGAVVDYARQGQLVDLSTYLDPGEARRQVGDYVVEATSLGSGYFGIPIELNLKGLVWYPVPEFEQAGYAIPESWDELLALSQQMVADGWNPWCIGFESGGSANGWPGTDWIEALVLRIGGVDLYEGWADGEIPFTDPVIRQAATMFGQVAFGEGFVRGGSDSISRLSDTDVGDPMFSDPPGCWLHHQASWMQVYFPPGAATGVDLDYFPMPPIAPGGDTPLFGGGGIVGAFRDRPEVREFLRSVLSPEWGTEWAANPSGAFLSPNLGFDVGHCRSPLLDEAANAVRVRLCREAQDEIAAGLWRFDAADLMPREVGSVTEAGTPGAFYQGMVDYVDEGPESLDRILSDIEAAWPESARP
jgi:serine/threonine protein kinase/ABC-type glycerol-3-phosphate transport system substrate-binding protein/DNA-binding SARP family transcriptional activator